MYLVSWGAVRRRGTQAALLTLPAALAAAAATAGTWCGLTVASRAAGAEVTARPAGGPRRRSRVGRPAPPSPPSSCPAVDRARRVEDLSAVRGQGLARAAVRRAALWTYPVLVAAAVVAGMAIAVLGWRLTGWALPLAGISPAALPLPSLSRAWTVVLTAGGAFVVLAGVAVLAGRWTLRAVR
jgi:hypothetical protein